MQIKLKVPYYSQFLDVEDREWMSRSCGMVCVKMVLDFYKIKSPDLDVLIKKGDEDGGYSKWGWLHDYFVHLFQDYGLSSNREEEMEDKDIQKLVSSLKNNQPVIISGIKRIFGQTKFHMVVLTGFEEKDGEVFGFYYHEPESMNKEVAQHMFVELGTFLKDWRKMAIFVQKSNT